MVIPIVICALGTICKGEAKELENLEIRGQEETIQTIALLRLVRILKRVLGTWEDLLSLKRPSVNAGGKNLQKNKMIIMNYVMSQNW